jgi:transposase-like protein
MLENHENSEDLCPNCNDGVVLKKTLIDSAKILDQELKVLEIREKKMKQRYSETLKELNLALQYFPNHNQDDQEADLLGYLSKQNLPSSLSSVICSKQFSVGFLIQSGIVVPSDKCICGSSMPLMQMGKSGNYVYLCRCGEIVPFLKNTIWGQSKFENPQHFLITIILFLTGCRDMEIRKLIAGYHFQTFHVFTMMRKVISQHYIESIGKLRGVVEIDESAFKRKNNCGSQSSHKWVFGLYERERKLVYMEIVKNRLATTLIPIVQKMCEPGTTIISDQWAAYNKLEEVGFPHFTVDHSRFFVNPHSREIHTQNIEISWGWAKYEIKRQNRSLKDLQNYLHFFSWKRQFKNHTDKQAELGDTLKALSVILKEFQRKYSEGKN